MNTTPECRYGHGALELIERPGTDHHWAFVGVNVVSFTAGHPVGEPLTSTSFDGTVYMVKLFRCPKCGYVEAFDTEATSNG
ncbi:hypothetical protein BM43_3177 [Burkholderia gladioli]|nr:hypothetical protein BM43_3177 [Burkholderia gladioli]ASD79132.1 hypothetical protein CEJ98_09010 [Burkholderia gladioli pv. gladioli]AWY55626.1 hypothetical protein A8H28_32150 [Burkholderia gladioli pv. gladioli]SPV21795.1 Uncharacterised protein [Burkholderia gladioli]